MTTHDAINGQFSPLDDCVTAQEIAEALQVSKRTIDRWWRRGVMPHPRRYGPRCLRWLTAEVNDWIKQREAANG